MVGDGPIRGRDSATLSARSRVAATIATGIFNPVDGGLRLRNP
jgi:hypothetical protein